MTNNTRFIFSDNKNAVFIIAGQAISIFGSAMTSFALALWAYQMTGKATPLALIMFFYMTPMMILGPLIGALVDQYSRKKIIMCSDAVAALSTVATLVLHISGNLQIWHIFVLSALAGIASGFHWLAFSSTVSLLVPKSEYGRVNGWVQMAGDGARIIGPISAGVIIGLVGLAGILAIDIITAVVAVLAVSLNVIPEPNKKTSGKRSHQPLLSRAAYGFSFIRRFPSLVALLLIFLLANFFLSLALPLLSPMILGRTGGDALVFGSVQTAGALGGFIGGAMVGFWGGPANKINGVLLGWCGFGLLGLVVLGVGQAIIFWVVGNFFLGFFNPLINSSSQSIWQAKVETDVQGRVFAARRLLSWLVVPLAQLASGPLGDKILEPAFANDSSILARVFGGMVGVGPGAGMAFLFCIAGFSIFLIGVSGYWIPRVRKIDTLLIDHNEKVAVVS